MTTAVPPVFAYLDDDGTFAPPQTDWRPTGDPFRPGIEHVDDHRMWACWTTTRHALSDGRTMELAHWSKYPDVCISGHAGCVLTFVRFYDTEHHQI